MALVLRNVWTVILAAALMPDSALHGSESVHVPGSGPPRVIATTPELGDAGVDPSLSELRIVFDRDMSPRGHSLCGGGPMFPSTGKLRWESPRVAVVPVRLAPDHEYSLSINCPAATNFRSADGEPAEPFPMRFRTHGGAPGTEPSPFAVPPTSEQQRESVAALRRAIEERYSYRDLRGVEWAARFAAHAEALEQAASRGAFAMEAARLLAAARDIHISIRVGIATIPTHRTAAAPNVRLDALRSLVPGWRERGPAVRSGLFDGEGRPAIGYIALLTCPGEPASLEPAFDALREMNDCPALIIDLRANGGGAELPVRDFAGCFLEAPAVYSLNDYRDPDAPSGFGRRFERTVEPSADQHRLKTYGGKVAVLIGPAVCSSAESLVLMLDANPRATLVGARTCGSSGNPRPVELPNGVVVLLPSWRDYFPDGTLLEGRGIEPEVPVKAEPGSFKDSDPVLDAALRLLRE
ncbi:MAG: S41 family peptidase [Phycisphaerales bacterium]